MTLPAIHRQQPLAWLMAWLMACAVGLLLCAAPHAAGNQALPPADKLARDALRIGVQSGAFPFAHNVGSADAPVYRGYAVDLCIEVVKGWRKRQGRSFEPDKDIQWVQVTPRNRLIKLLGGEIDMECGSTSSTAGRRALGIAFSPTYFVSGVGLLLRPELRPHTSSLMTLLSHVRETNKVLATTQGSTSEQHLQELAADVEASGSSRLRVKYGTSHDQSYGFLADSPVQAHGFLMDQVLLAAALQTNPKLKRAGLILAPWSPAPRAQECYGIMTRATNALRLQAGGHDLTQVVRDVILDLRQPPAAGGQSPMHQLYARWFQRPLAAADLRPGMPSGVDLDMAPSPALSRVLVSRARDAECP